jgi:hypothetical protein
MSWFRSNKPSTSSLNLRQGVTDASSLRLNNRSDLNSDASSPRLYNSTSKDRDAGSLVLGNHEAFESLVQRRTSEHLGEYMSDDEQDLSELWRQSVTKYK